MTPDCGPGSESSRWFESNIPPEYLEGNAGCSRMTREPREVTVGNQCVASYNQGKALELYGIVECKGIYRGLCLCQSNKHHWRYTQIG